jgi:hypothetical protein
MIIKLILDIMTSLELKELENILIEHCYDNGILKKKSEKKKKESILDSLIAAIVRSETTLNDIKDCIIDIKNDNVINLDFFIKGGNVYDYINPKWLKFAKALWRQRSVGLGTPNSASGEGELMFIFLSSKIKKPVKGDLLLNNENIEIKGENIRVNGKISGKNFRILTLDICKKYNLTPNISNKTNLESVEIEKPQHENHWKLELNKLSLIEQRQFIIDYLKCIDNNIHNIDDIFNPEFNFKNFKKKIVKILYHSMILDRSFDKFIILGNGSNAKVLNNNINDFNKQIDDENILILSDYFRINQDANIGWYIS